MPSFVDMFRAKPGMRRSKLHINVRAQQQLYPQTEEDELWMALNAFAPQFSVGLVAFFTL